MADWYAAYNGGSGANNINIHLVVNEGARTGSTVVVNFALYIERTVGTGFWAGTNSGNTASVVIAGETFSYANYTYDFRSGSGTFRQFFIGSGSKTISTTAPLTISVSATANQGVTPPGSATIGAQNFLVTPLPAFTDATINPIAIRGVAYSDGVSATSTVSYSIVASSLPSGLSLNTTTGAITGTATETFQSRNPVFRATNAVGTADTPALSITVNPPAPVFTDSTVSPSASIGSVYSDQVVATDAASYSVFSGSLPAGITLNTSTGVISGTPTTAGDSTFVIRATNVTGTANTPSRTINVISPVRVWNGSDFAVGSLKVWNGSDFAVGVVRVWNGSTFVSAK
jgi:hypothetical protein